MAKSKDNNSLYSTLGFRFLVLTTIVALALLGFKNLVQNYQNSRVLGTSSYLADRENDSDRSSGGSGSGSSDSSNTLFNTQTGIVAAPTTKPMETEDNTEAAKKPEAKTPESAQSRTINMENLEKVQFESENGHTKLRLKQGDNKLEISNETGKLSIKARDANGTELELEDKNTLDKINDALKNEDVEVGTKSGNLLTIRKGEIQAQTRFPLSIDPQTNMLTVTTPAGVKNVTVLPDAAVENLLQQGIIDKVKTTTAAANGGQLKLITLGLLNNEPAFQVAGADNKKLLGLLPVSIDKTTFVSAQTGQVIKVEETLLSRLFDLLSVQ